MITQPETRENVRKERKRVAATLGEKKEKKKKTWKLHVQLSRNNFPDILYVISLT